MNFDVARIDRALIAATASRAACGCPESTTSHSTSATARPRSPRARPCSAHAPRPPRRARGVAIPRPRGRAARPARRATPSIRTVALATDSAGAGPRVQAGDWFRSLPARAPRRPRVDLHRRPQDDDGTGLRTGETTHPSRLRPGIGGYPLFCFSTKPHRRRRRPRVLAHAVASGCKRTCFTVGTRRRSAAHGDGEDDARLDRHDHAASPGRLACADPLRRPLAPP